MVADMGSGVFDSERVILLVLDGLQDKSAECVPSKDLDSV